MRAESEPRRTLPRHLHRAILRLLRPAESAVRRLIIIAARGLVVTLPKPRVRKPKPNWKAHIATLRRLGIAVTMSPADFARFTAEQRAAEKRAAARRAGVPALPLVDPLRNPLRRRIRYTPAHKAPRIRSFDDAAPAPWRLPPPPSADDMIDATRIAKRLAALGRALDDLPGQARRFARWKARNAAGMQNQNARAAGRTRRRSPLKPGRAPGLSLAASRRPRHEVHEILKDMQYFAREVLAKPDTS